MSVEMSSAEVRCDRTIARPNGPLDVSTTPTFRRALAEIDVAEVQVIVDLGGVTLIDSCGLRAIAALVAEAKRCGRAVGVVSDDPLQIGCLTIAGLLPPTVLGATIQDAIDRLGSLESKASRDAGAPGDQDREPQRQQGPVRGELRDVRDGRGGSRGTTDGDVSVKSTNSAPTGRNAQPSPNGAASPSSAPPPVGEAPDELVVAGRDDRARPDDNAIVTTRCDRSPSSSPSIA